tara:strand:- start:423 stop:620 length:198 start_codon:yes stop_codon:yes gene_type:complete
MDDITQTKADERDQKAEQIFEDIYSVLVEHKLNIDPRANELGVEVDTFVELVLDYSDQQETTVVR